MHDPGKITVISQTDLAETYRSADIFVYPTRSDVYPTVVLEALSSGLFVIASDMLTGIFDNYQKKGFLEYCRNEHNALQALIISCSKRILTPDERKKVHEMVALHNDPKLTFEELSSCLAGFHTSANSNVGRKKLN